MNIINLHDKNLFYIGGVVRDKILGKESFDIDITYVGNAIEFAKTIPNAQILQINEPFGTVRIKLNNEEIDIASTRNETYPQKGHLPVVENIGCSLKDDVLRRDFTINAMAESTLTGEIIDYTGGLKDIETKTLRVLHDESFIDDPTRIVRGLKFAVRFGFELDEHTKELQDKYLNNINYDMSYKRLKKELVETFNLNSQSAFARFIEQGIYKLVNNPMSAQCGSTEIYDFEKGELSKIITKIKTLIDRYSPDCIWIIYVGLLPDISALPLTKQEKKIVDDFKNLKEKTFNTDFEIYKNFEGLNIESIIMFASVNPNAVEKYFEKLQKIELEITGKDLQDLGIKPSCEYQKCFDFILNEKIKNPEINKSQEIQLAKKYFSID